MPGSDGDSLLVEYRTDVVRVDIFDSKRQHRSFFAGRTNDLHAFDIRQTPGRIFKQFVLILGGFRKIDRVQVIDCGTESDVGRDGWSSCFEFIGDRCKGRSTAIPTVSVSPLLDPNLEIRLPGLVLQ